MSPSSLPRPCRIWSCPKVTTRADGFCSAECARAYDRQRRRPSAAQRGYDNDWRKVRAQILEAEPYCRPCRAAGKMTPATVVDHIVPLSQGGARLDPGNLQPCCQSCHQTKTHRDNRP